MMDYPSPIIEVVPPGVFGGPSVQIPRNELFRIQNIFEEHEYAIPQHYLPSGKLTIVDIGANVGLFALYMDKQRSDCDIYCFEPAPQTQKLLCQNLANHSQVKIFPFALSDHNATAQLHLHRLNSGENSLKQDCNSSPNTVSVEVKDAATVFRKVGLNYIDILKIDTEGSEIEILRSLQPYLPYTGIIMAEYHSEADRRQIDQLLQNHLLFDAKPSDVHLGVVKYINSRLVEL